MMGARRVVWTEEMIATVRDNVDVLKPGSIAGLLGVPYLAVLDLMREQGWLRHKSTGVLGQLTAEERTAYDALMRGKIVRRLEALEMIGRGDLVAAARREPVPFQARVRVRGTAARRSASEAPVSSLVRPIPAPLSALSPGELADYRFARKSGLSRDEALSAAGRRDLTGQIAANRRRAADARAAMAAAQEERV